MEKKYESAREFSKEHAQAERDKVAEAILEKRALYFDRRKGVREKVADLREQALEKRDSVEVVVAQVREIEETLLREKSSAFSELFRLFEVRYLRKELSGKIFEQHKLEKEYEEIISLIRALEEGQEGRHEFDEAKKILGEFYNTQSEEWGKYEAEEQSRDIKNIAQQNEVTFIHSIRPDFRPGGNSILESHADWETKLEIVLALQPSLAASTIRAGDGPRNMWGKMGVILSGGRVEYASPGDAGSVAVSVSGRYHNTGWQGSVVEQTQEALNKRSSDGYNEFGVSEPQVAGMYVCEGETLDEKMESDVVGYDKIWGVAQRLGLPVYVIEKGRIFHGEKLVSKDNFGGGQYYDIEKGNEVDCQVIEASVPHLSEREKEAIVEEIFEKQPFQVELAEKYLIESRNSGRRVYIELNGHEYVERGKADEEIVASFPDVIYRMKKGRLERESEIRDPYFSKRDYRATDLVADLDNGRSVHNTFMSGCRLGSVPLGFYLWSVGNIPGTRTWGNIHGETEPVTSIGVFLDLAVRDLQKNDVEDVKKMKRELESNLRLNNDPIDVIQGRFERGMKFHNNFRRQKAFFLYGLSEQAESFNDLETKEKAFTIASSIVPYEEYLGILRKRLDEKGRFKVMPEDIGA